MIYSRTFIAIPPGETIKEQLSYREMNQKEFALRMGLSEKHITNLLKGRVNLTSDVALRLEMVLGIPATFWENLEAIYRENLIKVKNEQQLEVELKILRKLPVEEMVKFNWLSRCVGKYDKVVALRKFFEVSTLELINRPEINRIACRRLSSSEKSDYALIAWVQKAKLEARKIETKSVNIKNLRNAVSALRCMSKMPPNEFCAKLVETLSENGVALVFLPHFKGSALHGASFYDGKKIVVGLTVRGRDADKFWFSLFHEMAHIIYGHIGQPNGTTEDDEKKADEFAAETLIPADDLNNFIRSENYTDESLNRFANLVDVDVSILVGRLQHEGIIQYNRFNHLKKKYQII